MSDSDAERESVNSLADSQGEWSINPNTKKVEYEPYDLDEGDGDEGNFAREIAAVPFRHEPRSNIQYWEQRARIHRHIENQRRHERENAPVDDPQRRERNARRNDARRRRRFAEYYVQRDIRYAQGEVFDRMDDRIEEGSDNPREWTWSHERIDLNGDGAFVQPCEEDEYYEYLDFLRQNPELRTRGVIPIILDYDHEIEELERAFASCGGPHMRTEPVHGWRKVMHGRLVTFARRVSGGELPVGRSEYRLQHLREAARAYWTNNRDRMLTHRTRRGGRRLRERELAREEANREVMGRSPGRESSRDRSQRISPQRDFRPSHYGPRARDAYDWNVRRSLYNPQRDSGPWSQPVSMPSAASQSEFSCGNQWRDERSSAAYTARVGDRRRRSRSRGRSFDRQVRRHEMDSSVADHRYREERSPLRREIDDNRNRGWNRTPDDSQPVITVNAQTARSSQPARPPSEWFVTVGNRMPFQSVTELTTLGERLRLYFADCEAGFTASRLVRLSVLRWASTVYASWETLLATKGSQSPAAITAPCSVPIAAAVTAPRPLTLQQAIDAVFVDGDLTSAAKAAGVDEDTLAVAVSDRGLELSREAITSAAVAAPATVSPLDDTAAIEAPSLMSPAGIQTSAVMELEEKSGEGEAMDMTESTPFPRSAELTSAVILQPQRREPSAERLQEALTVTPTCLATKEIPSIGHDIERDLGARDVQPGAEPCSEPVQTGELTVSEIATNDATRMADWNSRVEQLTQSFAQECAVGDDGRRGLWTTKARTETLRYEQDRAEMARQRETHLGQLHQRRAQLVREIEQIDSQLASVQQSGDDMQRLLAQLQRLLRMAELFSNDASL